MNRRPLYFLIPLGVLLIIAIFSALNSKKNAHPQSQTNILPPQKSTRTPSHLKKLSHSDRNTPNFAQSGPSRSQLIEQYGAERLARAETIHFNYFFTYSLFVESVKKNIWSLEQGKDRYLALLETLGVTIDEENGAACAKAYHQYSLRELATLQASLSQFILKPEPFFELILASDAQVNGKLSPEDYALIQQGHAETFGNLPADLNSEPSSFIYSNATTDTDLHQKIANILASNKSQPFHETMSRFEESAREANLAPPTLANIRAQSLQLRERRSR